MPENTTSLLTHKLRRLAAGGGDSRALSEQIYNLLQLERQALVNGPQESDVVSLPEVMARRRFSSSK